MYKKNGNIINFYYFCTMFKVYKSSAGSGKTTQLVIEYLTLCMQDISKYKQILAITFTNNATAEMKNRIVETLQTFAFKTPENFGNQRAMFDKISQNLQFSPEKMQETAQNLLENILYDYPNFAISTIDSFFQRIIRAFAFDLGLNMDFNLEISLDDFFTQTVDLLLNKLSAENKTLSRRVMNFVEKQMETTGKWNIEYQLRSILPTLYDEVSYVPLKRLQEVGSAAIEKEANTLYKNAEVLNQQICALATRGAKIIKESNLSKEDFFQGAKGVFSWFDKVLQKNGKEIPGCTYVQKAIEKGSFTKKDGLLSAAVTDELTNLSLQILDTYIKYVSTEMLTKNMQPLLFIFDLKQIMDDIKLRDNLFFLSETNMKIFDEVKDEDAPYIYEKLGNRYNYFFIDEFQDTSRMQWEDLLPLLKNALSQSATHGGQETGKTILFGDMKQAIYRFRNGDASLFEALSQKDGSGYRAHFGIPQHFPIDYECENLGTNYRSSRSIISFNNLYFRYLTKLLTEDQSASQVEHFYDDLEQKIPDGAVEGFVSIEFMTDEEAQEENANLLNIKVLDAVRDAMARGFQYKDIAVLARGNADCSNFGRWLAQHQIPVISSDSLLLKSSPEVNLLISAMKYLYNGDDNISKLFIFNYLNAKSGRLRPPFTSTEETPNFLELLSDFGVHFDRQKLRQLPLYSLATELMSTFELTETNAFVMAFLDHVFDFSNARGNALTHFLDWWEKQPSLSLTSSDKLNAVTISTVHKAKGLGYPVVIFAERPMKASPTKKKIWLLSDDEEGLPVHLVNCNKSLEHTAFAEIYQEESANSLLDALNLWYVAYTRPKECLYVISGKASAKNKLANFVQQRADDFEQEETRDRYWYGDRLYTTPQKPTKNVESATEPTISKFHLASYSRHNMVPEDVKEKSAEQDKGIAIHQFLSNLYPFPQNEEAISRLDFSSVEEYKSLIINILKNILHDDELRPYFSETAQAVNETTILTKHGELLRPDRVVFLDNEVMVIDYKTGQENEKYQQQIDRYCHWIREMGYPNVKSKIIYLNRYESINYQ